MLIRGLVAAAMLVLGSGVAWGVGTPPQVDHHMHIFSPESSRVLGVICEALGPEGCPPQVSHAPATGADAAAALDKAGIRRGVLLSAAYLFGSPELVGAKVDVAKGMRAENTLFRSGDGSGFVCERGESVGECRGCGGT
jgi:hypothetical protein